MIRPAFLIAIPGVALALQGWRERVPAIDLVPHYLDAVALVRDGVVPVRGTISGYLAYNPPGPTWLMSPGVLVTDDPRVVEFIASAPLYLATLLGIYCLARSAFSRRTAILAAALYAFSEVGLFVAGTVWPRAPIQPFFVWMVYWLQRWSLRREAYALPLALALWAIGMYIFMEIAPAILLVLFCWYKYRPPVHVRQLAAAAVGVLAVWSPYLAYEAARDYRDVRSMVLRATVERSTALDQRARWCDPSLTVVTDHGRVLGQPDVPSPEIATSGISGGAATAGYDLLLRLRGAGQDTIQGVIGRTLPDSRTSVVLFVLCAIALLAVALGSTGLSSLVSRTVPYATSRFAMSAVLAGTAVFVPGLLVRTLSPDGSIEAATSDALRALRVLLLAAAAVLAFATPVSMALGRLAKLVRKESQGSPARAFLLFAAIVPWAALVVLVEPGRSDRLWWLWPLAAVFLAALICDVVGTSSPRRRILAVGLGGLVLGLTWITPSNLTRLQSWQSAGWAGRDADVIRAVEYVASRAEHGQARIGYHLHFFRGIPALGAVDPRFKVGAELDLALSQRHGIVNSTQCTEGFAPDDEYRLADQPARPSNLGTYRIVASPGPEFRLVRRFGGTDVFERVRPAVQ